MSAALYDFGGECQWCEPPSPDDSVHCRSCGANVSDTEHDDNGGLCTICADGMLECSIREQARADVEAAEGW